MRAHQVQSGLCKAILYGLKDDELELRVIELEEKLQDLEEENLKQKLRKRLHGLLTVPGRKPMR